MPHLDRIVVDGRTPRAIGFDDGPFERVRGAHVPLIGIATRGTRIEGMLVASTTMGGSDATAIIADTIVSSRLLQGTHVVLTDGVTVGGLNVIDLLALHEAVQRPCIAVMRKPPNMDNQRRILLDLEDGEARWQAMLRAGPIHELGGFVFQVHGASPEVAMRALSILTDTGKVPEPLRLAHLIGRAIVTGHSAGGA